MISSPPSPQNPERYLPPIPPDARYAPPGSLGDQALPPVPQNTGLPPVPGSSPARRVVPFNPQPQQQALPPVPNNSVYRGPEKPVPAAVSPIPQKTQAPTSPASGKVRTTSLTATAFKPIAQPPPKRVFCPAAIDLMDESITLFFRLPPSILATYYVACLPLFIAFAWFWHDMRNGVNSNTRVLPESLVLTILFCLMKVGQAAFCSKVYHRLAASQDQPWTLWRIHHVGVLQTIYAGSFFIIYPASFLITFPFPWVNSFYHNIALTASDSKATISSSFKEASKLSLLWPGKNAFGFLYQSILALVVLTNLVVGAIVAPLFLKYLLNIDSSFAENPMIFFSSSEFLFVLILCFLITNPINKIYHVLRCFYGRSRSSGVDLVSALRVRKSAAAALVVLFISAMLLSIGPLRADSDNTPAPPASDTQSTDSTPSPKPENQPTPKPADAFHLDQKGKTLDQAIDKTLSGGGTDYDWRTGDPSRDPLLAFIVAAGKFLDEILDAINAILKALFESKGNQGEHMQPSVNLPLVKAILILVLGATALLLIAALISVLLKMRKNRVLPSLPLVPPTRIVDLNEENVMADALPEDSWLQLARDLINKGELRLALRAFYLASLSTMASREWVKLARGKSNRDYQREFARRLHTKEAPVAYFSETMDLFEASWYGDHSVTDTVLTQAEKNHQLLRQYAS